MLTQAQFVASVEKYLADSDTTPTTFGKAVAGDPNFVFDLRRGRSPSLATVERVLRFIAENPNGPVPELARAG